MVHGLDQVMELAVKRALVDLVNELFLYDAPIDAYIPHHPSFSGKEVRDAMKRASANV